MERDQIENDNTYHLEKLTKECTRLSFIRLKFCFPFNFDFECEQDI